MIARPTARRASNAHTLYEGLARYHWFCRRLRGAAPGEGLEMHKRLGPPADARSGPPAGTRLHDWLWQVAGLDVFDVATPADVDGPAAVDGTQAGARSALSAPRPRVLEVGCGFGATLLHWARQHGGTFVGVGDSPFQIERARAQARRLGVQGRCEFRVQSHADPMAGAFDVVLGVETFLHARDLDATLRRLAPCIAPGGRLVALEDVARDAAGAAAARALSDAWSATRIWSVQDWEGAASRAGLRLVTVHDLSGQVRPRPEPRRRRAERFLRGVRALALTAQLRGLADAFLGGIELERLQERGEVLYRCMVFTSAGTRP